jgi:hypothetical protein
MKKIIGRAGLKPWRKLFQNLRSTRETELARKHPLHVVCAWIGNSQLIAAKHYLQVTDEDFEKAVGQKAQRNALQSGVIRRSTASPSVSGSADFLEEYTNPRNSVEGLNGRCRTRTSSDFLEQNAMLSSKRHMPNLKLPADLAKIVAAWPRLPEASRRAILALVDTA